MVHFAVIRCRMDWETAVWRTPLRGLLLLLREEGRQNGDNGITLEDKQVIDEWQPTT